MNEHPSFLVFQTLPHFFESRGLVLPEGNSFDIRRERFITELELIGYFRVDARSSQNGDYKIVTIIVLALSGKYTDHGPQLRGLIASLNSEDFARAGRLSEVIIIAPEDIMKKKNMTDVISDFSGAVALKKGTPGTLEGPPPAAESYTMYPYPMFSFNVPKAQNVPEHEILTDAQVQSLLTYMRLGIRDLPRIPSSSPPVVWIGGRAGDVVSIKQPSKTAGLAYNYCVVTQG
jgi:DNA-directed RNA polymerase subunit H (RpoH/RPB5)